MSKVKINEIFRPLLTSKDRYYFITGGRGSGKSFSVAWSILMLTFEVGHTILYSRLTLVSAKDSIIPEFVNMIERMGLEDAFDVTNTHVINKLTGSKIWFRGLKASAKSNTAKLKSLAGVTTWVIDEFEDMMDEEVLFDKIDNSIRTKENQNRVIMIMNPQTREFWAYERWFERPGVHPRLNSWSTSKEDTTYIHTTWLDCAKHLDNSWIAKALRVQRYAPEKYEHEYLGGWKDAADGVVYTNWSILNNNDPKSEDYYVWEDGRIYDPTDPNRRTNTLWLGDDVFGQDYGWFPDVTTLIKIGIDKPRKKIFVHECFYKNNMETPEITRENLKHAGKNNLIIGDSAEIRLINEVAKYCNIIACKKGPGSIVEGIQAVQDFELVVTATSTNLIKELRNYIWDDKKKDKPVDKWNHALDALRYAVMDQLLDAYDNDLIYY